MVLHFYITDGEKVLKKSDVIQEHEDLINTLEEHQTKMPKRDEDIDRLIKEQNKYLNSYRPEESDREDLVANLKDEIKAIAQYEADKVRTNDPRLAALFDHIQEEEEEHQEELEDALEGEFIEDHFDKSHKYIKKIPISGKGKYKYIYKEERPSHTQHKYGDEGTYEGFRNWDTWATALHMSKDEPIYRRLASMMQAIGKWKSRGKYNEDQARKGIISVAKEAAKAAHSQGDNIDNSSVDWIEVADHFLQDLDNYTEGNK